MNAATQRIVDTFTRLSPANVAQLGRIYAADAHFVDPFNNVQGLAAIQQVYHHMYSTLVAPRFDVRHCIDNGDHCVLLWDFHFRFRSMRKDVAHSLEGATHLVLDADGLISLHRDYWDPAQGIYEKLPVLGALMRRLRRHAAS